MDLSGIRYGINTNIQYTGTEAQKAEGKISAVNTSTQTKGESLSLKPGQLIRGEIVSREGSDVQIKVGDHVVNARLDQSISANVGQRVVFEVKSMNNNTIALRPLYENLTNDTTVAKALTAAGMPANTETVAMVSAMMEEGMPINGEALQNMFLQISDYPEANIHSIVQMNRLEIPVTNENLQQFEAYKSSEHQLMQTFEQVAGEIPDAVSGIYAQGNTAQGDQLVAELLHVFAEGLQDEAQIASGNEIVLQTQDGMVTEGRITGIDTYDPAAVDLSGEEVSVSMEESAMPAAAGEQSGMLKTDNLQSQSTDVSGQIGERQQMDGTVKDVSLEQMNRSPDMPEMMAKQSQGITEDSGSGTTIAGNLQTEGNASTAPGSESVNGTDLTGANPSAVFSEKMMQGVQTDQTQQMEKAFQTGIQSRNPAISAEEVSVTDGAGTIANQVLAEAADPSTTPVYTALANMSQGEVMELANLLQQAGAQQEVVEALINGESSTTQIYQTVMELADKAVLGQKSDGAKEDTGIGALFLSKGFQSILKDVLGQQWSLTPDNLKNKEVQKMYERVSQQTRQLSQALETLGKTDTALYKSVTNIRSNVDFMNQLNQLYTYVQLPMKLKGESANGELFVYTNKKNLAKNDGNVSALLHLDMEHLGMVDCYVVLEHGTKITTNFTLEDEETLDLVAEHIDWLTERLAEKGYDLSSNVKTRNSEEESTVMEEILKKDKNISVISMSAFDMRA